MPLSFVQQGTIGENEVAKIAMLTTDGELEFDLPSSDDEARDRELHERGHFGHSLALQIKTSMHLLRDRRENSQRLAVYIKSKHPSWISHPLYWFLFAFLDSETMTFREPLFLIPSKVLFGQIKSTVKYKKTGQLGYLFRGDMAPDSHDMWAPYHVLRKDLGPRLLEILRGAEHLSPTASRLPDDFTLEPGMVWAGTRRSRLRVAA